MDGIIWTISSSTTRNDEQQGNPSSTVSTTTPTKGEESRTTTNNDSNNTTLLPFPPEHLTIALQVLEALGRDISLYQSKPLRPLRTALQPLFQSQNQRMFDGKAKDDHDRLKHLHRKESHRRHLEKLEDQSFIEKTKLRAGRLQKLNNLLSTTNELGIEIPRILDGAVEMDDEDGYEGKNNSTLLLQNQPNTHEPDHKKGRSDDNSPSSSSSTVMMNNNESSTEPQPEQPPLSIEGNNSNYNNTTTTTGESTEDTYDEDTQGKRTLHRPRSCYICKVRFRELHHFYDTLCPRCSELNYRKRTQSTNLHGRIALVTGARVKIGFQCTLKLLRAGATVIATSRFPIDTARRFAELTDYSQWQNRLHVYGLDFRDLQNLEFFCIMLNQRYTHLDIIVNNACQTVRRPPAFYSHLIAKESTPYHVLPETVKRLVSHDYDFHQYKVSAINGGLLTNTIGTNPYASSSSSSSTAVRYIQDQEMKSNDSTVNASSSSSVGTDTTALLSPDPSTTISLNTSSSSMGTSISSNVPVTIMPTALQSQMIMAPGDAESLHDLKSFPVGMQDVNEQQIDLRHHNSWRMRLHEVSTPELIEVMAINTAAPFILNSRLKPLMMRPNPLSSSPTTTATTTENSSSSSSTTLMTTIQPKPFHGTGTSSLAESLLASMTSTTDLNEKLGGTKRGQPVGGANKRPRKEVMGGNLEGEQASHGIPVEKCRFIVNVSAMEGKFYRAKTTAHPHTNMAKAALNMMTRTSATDYAEAYIYMTAVDTGWINDENPLERAARTAKENKFATPLDEIDAAARVIDPIFAPLIDGAIENGGNGMCSPLYGCFLKDYFTTEW